MREALSNTIHTSRERKGELLWTDTQTQTSARQYRL